MIRITQTAITLFSTINSSNCRTVEPSNNRTVEQSNHRTIEQSNNRKVEPSNIEIKYLCKMKLRQIDIEKANAFNKNTLMETLDITFIEIGDDFIRARMPVNHKTHQPLGLLHGGASAALIESIGSMGSTLLIDIDKEAPVGVEINANHIAGVKSGFVVATGKIIHAGKRTHVWQVDIIEDDTERLICTGRLTVMIVERKS